MNNHTTAPSPDKSALIAGISLLVMVIAAPFSEMYAYPKLATGDAAQTLRNIIANETHYNLCIVGYLVTFICDILVACYGYHVRSFHNTQATHSTFIFYSTAYLINIPV